MSKTIGCVVAVLAVALILVLWGVGQYNGLVTSQENVNTAWAQVQNVYQRRMDLIPNLVATVKGVAAFERETYTAVTEARSQAGKVTISPDLLNDPQAFARFEQTQGQLSSALSRLLVVVENYPQLKANQNFLDLQSQLEGTENRIAVERKRFNEAAQEYNTRRRKFPTVLVAGILGFQERPYFRGAEGAEKAPEVKF